MYALIFYAFALISTAGSIYSLMAGQMIAGQKAVGIKPVTSVWRTPEQGVVSHALPFFSAELPLHDTQILYGERVVLLEDNKNGWFKVRLPEQPVFDGNTSIWRPLEGWVQCDDVILVDNFVQHNLVVRSQWASLMDRPNEKTQSVQSVSFGTMFYGTQPADNSWWQILLPTGAQAIVSSKDVSWLDQLPSDTDSIRKNLVEFAKDFLASPYCAGGRSAWDKAGKQSITSVDCSGLVNLVYRACGFCVPRYAHYQWLRATPVKPQDLLPGDLVFVKYQKDNFKRVRHVMMYLGDDLLIEATGLQSICTETRIVSFQDKLGLSLQRAYNGQRTSLGGRSVDEREIYCGSFLTDPVMMQQMRDDLRSLCPEQLYSKMNKLDISCDIIPRGMDSHMYFQGDENEVIS